MRLSPTVRCLTCFSVLVFANTHNNMCALAKTNTQTAVDYYKHVCLHKSCMGKYQNKIFRMKHKLCCLEVSTLLLDWENEPVWRVWGWWRWSFQYYVTTQSIWWLLFFILIVSLSWGEHEIWSEHLLISLWLYIKCSLLYMSVCIQKNHPLISCHH